VYCIYIIRGRNLSSPTCSAILELHILYPIRSISNAKSSDSADRGGAIDRTLGRTVACVGEDCRHRVGITIDWGRRRVAVQQFHGIEIVLRPKTLVHVIDQEVKDRVHQAAWFQQVLVAPQHNGKSCPCNGLLYRWDRVRTASIGICMWITKN